MRTAYASLVSLGFLLATINKQRVGFVRLLPISAFGWTDTTEEIKL